MTLALHLVTGEPALLGPVRLPAALAASTLGPRVRAVEADWLARDQAKYGHDFLLDGEDDRRVAATARTLAVDFGEQTEPCLLLPSLMSAHRSAAAGAMLAELDEALRRMGRPCRLVLQALSLPGRPDPQPGLEAVAAELRGLRLQAALAPSPVVHPLDSPVLTGRMQRNLTTLAVAREVAAAADELGLQVSDPLQVARMCELWLSAWQGSGLVPADPLDPDHLHHLAQAIVRNVLSGVSPKSPEPRARPPL